MKTLGNEAMNNLGTPGPRLRGTAAPSASQQWTHVQLTCAFTHSHSLAAAGKTRPGAATWAGPPRPTHPTQSPQHGIVFN